MLDVKDIMKFATKPELYQKGTAVMWTDSYISKQLLQVHLNPDVDLASRKVKTIKATVKWILKKVGKSNLKILDLGCGPGLYSQLLAQEGHKVTGIDFSDNSIKYAIKTAKENNLEIEYHQQNYLDLEEVGKYDLVILVYTDFGVLVPEDRDTLLGNIHHALKPGGFFLFDVLNDTQLDQRVTPNNWDLSEKGFWRDKPYLALSNSFLYPDAKAILYQHCVIEADHQEVYRFWTHFFSHEDLKGILARKHFKEIEFFEDVLPESDIWNGQNVTFCVSRKDRRNI